MDYSYLVKALEINDSKGINKLMKGLRPRLVAFLRIHMDADKADAEDCAQDALILAMEAIREGQLKNSDQVISYILTICRNTYLKMQKKHRELYIEDIFPEDDYLRQAPLQLQSLFEDDQQRLLEWCLSQLKESHRLFMEYWLNHPKVYADKVANLFGISTNSVWTRKHRLLKKLNECYRKKIKK